MPALAVAALVFAIGHIHIPEHTAVTSIIPTQAAQRAAAQR